MATCLMACFGQVVRQDGIKVFSRLGGKYLGNIDVDKKSKNALQQVRFLQQQLVRIFPHPTRTHEDLLLYVDQQQVGPPGMPYTTEFSPQERLDVEQALSSIKSTKTIHVMWDESDEHAQRVINKTTHVCMEHEPNVFCIMLYKAVPKEITYLARRWAKQGVTAGTITNLGAPCVQDLRFLRNLNLTSLLLKDVVPTSWADCNVQALQVKGTQLDFAFDNLDKVEELSLLDRDYSRYVAGRALSSVEQYKNYTFGSLRNCPNVKKLVIHGYLTHETAKELVKTLTSMPKLKTLSFKGHAPSSLSNDLHAIPNLSFVQVELYGDESWIVWTFGACLVVACLALVWLALVLLVAILW
jgi:hypothetical protein